MPSNEIVKIKWVRKRPVVYITAAFIILAAILMAHSGTFLYLSRATYMLESVSTEADKKRGLSGRPDLARNKGMLFIYTAYSERCFWMKDMHFPIDIIWADAGKKITRIEANVSPKSYPKTLCAPGQYVIELNAHEAGRNDLKEGQTLTF